MQIEALPFVNWIFWAGLSSGTLLVVGVSELLGGTTRGYRLFMAWLLVAFAIVLVVSDLNLPSDAQAAATADLRRPLALAFAGGCAGVPGGVDRPVAAELARGGHGQPRPGGARRSGGGRRQPERAALRRSARARGAGAGRGERGDAARSLVPRDAEALTGAAAPDDVAAGRGAGRPGARASGLRCSSSGPMPLEGGIAWLTWLRLGVGILLPIVVTVLALLASRAASLQASTGLLYIGLALVMAGSIAGCEPELPHRRAGLSHADRRAVLRLAARGRRRPGGD